jgi:enoyl-CoA hydratase/carnithine racemase
MSGEETIVRVERDSAGLAVLTLDSPPLNLFDRRMFAGLLGGIEAVESDPPRALLIRAEGRAVSAGVDVAEFDGLTPELAAGPTKAHAMTKLVLRRFREGGIPAADEAIRTEAGELFATEDLQHAVKTFLDKGPGHAEFEGR